jgi:hypothetical protein
MGEATVRILTPTLNLSPCNEYKNARISFEKMTRVRDASAEKTSGNLAYLEKVDLRF